MHAVYSAEQLSFGQEFDMQSVHCLFFGIWPDVGATHRLTQLVARLRNEKIVPGRPVNANRLHITLHHLGDFINQIPPSLVPTASLAATTVKMQPFNVAFDRVGGTKGKFLLRASDRSAALMEFRQTLSLALVKAGLRSRADVVFNPHVTLSYGFSDVPEKPVLPISWTVSQFVLVESLIGKHQHVNGEVGRCAVEHLNRSLQGGNPASSHHRQAEAHGRHRS